VISVASNEIPGPMTQLAQACLRGDFETARAIQARYLPLMNINFVESNPIPVKAAMGLMGCSTRVSSAHVRAQRRESGEDRKSAGSSGPRRECVGCRLKSRAFSTTSRPSTKTSTSSYSTISKPAQRRPRAALLNPMLPRARDGASTPG